MKITMRTLATLIILFLAQFNIAQTLGADSLVGSYTGTWENATYSSSGDANLELSLIGDKLSMQLILDFDGFLGGLLNQDTLTISGVVSASAITIDTSLTEGNLFLTWDVNGAIEWEFSNITALGIDSARGSGTGNAQEVNMDYTVWITGSSSAVGTAHLTKQASSIEEYISNIRPDSYRLFNNYPNPFNPTTTIYFSIPETGGVSLKVYNGIGEEIAELINENMLSGIHNIRFDASSLPSGVYLYKLTAGSFSQTKKMILVK